MGRACLSGNRRRIRDESDGFAAVGGPPTPAFEKYIDRGLFAERGKRRREFMGFSSSLERWLPLAPPAVFLLAHGSFIERTVYDFERHAPTCLTVVPQRETEDDS